MRAAPMLMTPGDRPAKLHYMANNFRVLVRGDHVLCAGTGARIPLDALKYWSVARQEPYATAQAATAAMSGDAISGGAMSGGADGAGGAA